MNSHGREHGTTLPCLHCASVLRRPACNRTPTASQDDEEQVGGRNLSKHGLEVQQLLKRAGLSESDDDPSNQASSLLFAEPHGPSLLCLIHSQPSLPPTLPLTGLAATSCVSEQASERAVSSKHVNETVVGVVDTCTHHCPAHMFADSVDSTACSFTCTLTSSLRQICCTDSLFASLVHSVACRSLACTIGQVTLTIIHQAQMVAL